MPDARALTTTPVGLVAPRHAGGPGPVGLHGPDRRAGPLARWPSCPRTRRTRAPGRTPASPAARRGRGGRPGGRRAPAPCQLAGCRDRQAPAVRVRLGNVPRPRDVAAAPYLSPPRLPAAGSPAWLPRRRRSGGGSCPTFTTSAGWAPVPGSCRAGRRWPRPSARKPQPTKKRNSRTARDLPWPPEQGRHGSGTWWSPPSRARFHQHRTDRRAARGRDRLRDRRRRGPLREWDAEISPQARIWNITGDRTSGRDPARHRARGDWSTHRVGPAPGCCPTGRGQPATGTASTSASPDTSPAPGSRSRPRARDRPDRVGTGPDALLNDVFTDRVGTWTGTPGPEAFPDLTCRGSNEDHQFRLPAGCGHRYSPESRRAGHVIRTRYRTLLAASAVSARQARESGRSPAWRVLRRRAPAAAQLHPSLPSTRPFHVKHRPDSASARVPADPRGGGPALRARSP